jgi:hypothetical protein
VSLKWGSDHPRKIAAPFPCTLQYLKSIANDCRKPIPVIAARNG